MRAERQLRLLTALVALAFVLAPVEAGRAETGGIIPVKLGLRDMNKTERANLWKMVDEYATVDALQEFCGKKTNIHRRAWNAVAACVEVRSLRRVLAKFRSKKSEYLKAWKDLYGEDKERKEELCKRYRSKLSEYTRIMNGQIAEAADMCRKCFFC